MSKQPIEFTKSSGNVFEDLGFANAGERLAKAKLAFLINDLIDERGLKQIETADILGITQPKVSALMRGRLSGFSVERLMHFLNLLDQDIEIIVHPKAHDASVATLSVIANQQAKTLENLR